LQKLLAEQSNAEIRVFVIWEPVLPTDLASPSTRTLARLSDLRANQYWDKEHLVSQAIGEGDPSSVVWDYVAIYAPGKLWEQALPEPAYANVPVVRSINGARAALQNLLPETKK
jgi:hypothetical protein